MTITARFIPKTGRGPVADAIIEFHSDCGPLAGFELQGFSIWRKDGKLFVTGPCRQYQDKEGTTKYWDFLRLQQDANIPDSQKWAVKNWLVREFEAADCVKASSDEVPF